MTMPNGPDGLNAAILDLAFPLTADPDYTTDDHKRISLRDGFDQPTVETMLKEVMQGSAGWNSAHEAGFAGLPAGIPMVLGIGATMVEGITGLPLDDLLEPWLDNPVVENLSASVGSVFGVLGDFMGALMEFLGNINFLDPDFDPEEAIISFIELMLLPAGLIPELVGGLLPTSVIPGLDASKIVSGLFSFAQIDGLEDIFDGFDLGGDSIITQLLGLIPGATGGLTGLGGLGDVFEDLFGLLGDPTAVGSGTPVLPGISSIPILGGLLSGGNILSSIIPGLDASKITTGTFAMSMVTNLSTMLGGFGTGTSIITQLLGLIPNLAGSTTGLTGLGDVFTDLFSLLGNPTNVGSTGTLTLPGIGSIPLLAGILNGGGTNFLASLIPGLDTSKITTGTFSQSMVTGLTALADDVVDIPLNMFNAWFGSGGTGSVAEVTTTVEAIHDAVLSGYTVTTFTTSTPNWDVPAHTEMIANIINAGQNGTNGLVNASGNGGVGGLHGSHLVQAIDLTGITQLDLKIGTAGVKSQVRVANGSYTGTLIVEGATYGSSGGMANAFGFTPTASLPGSGGDGGLRDDGTGTNVNTGEAGEETALAAGGTAGPAANNGHGGAGGTVSAGAAVKCGGGGGGGGGRINSFGSNGGNGGAGGFPGGGGGGGAGKNTGNPPGNAGTGGAGGGGVIWLFYK